MKRFLIRLGIWLLILFAVATLFDLIVTTGLKKSQNRKYVVWNDIFGKEIDSDLLVIGSSRAWCQYSTYILDSLLHCNSYNLGIDGHRFDMQLVRYQTYRRFNPKPDFILLNTEFLSTIYNYSDPQYEREQFFPYIGETSLINAIAKKKEITWRDQHIPFLRYFGYHNDINEGVGSFLGKKSFADGGLYKGYRGNDYEWDRGILKTDSTFHVGIDWAVVNLLDGFVRDSAKDSIQVIFVKSPVYRPLLDRFTGIPVTDSIFASIADKYHVPVLDYYYSPIGLDSTNFYNPSHLNKKGSELFTKQLCEDLRAIVHPD